MARMNSPQRIPGEKIEELLDRLLDRGNSVADAPLYPSVPSLGRGADCPEDAVWQRIALRPTRDEDSRDLIDHAAGCQRCGTILNFWASVLCEEETPEESSALARLSTQSLGWQERMTKTLAGAKQPAKAGRKRGRAAWPVVLGIAGTIAATGLVFFFL